MLWVAGGIEHGPLTFNCHTRPSTGSPDIMSGQGRRAASGL